MTTLEYICDKIQKNNGHETHSLNLVKNKLIYELRQYLEYDEDSMIEYIDDYLEYKRKELQYYKKIGWDEYVSVLKFEIEGLSFAYPDEISDEDLEEQICYVIAKYNKWDKRYRNQLLNILKNELNGRASGNRVYVTLTWILNTATPGRRRYIK